MATTNERVNRHREALRASGLRPLQIWVPDTRRAGFAAECHRQAKLAAQADRADAELMDLADEALTDIEGWTE